jgi:hypothetical protein
MFAVALDDFDVGVTRRIVAPKHIEESRARKAQLDIIGCLLEPFVDIAESLRIPKRRKHVALYAGLAASAFTRPERSRHVSDAP